MRVAWSGWALRLLVASAALAAAQRAHADDTQARADALFREGRRAADRGEWAVACAKFRESRAAEPAPGTLLNLADCEEARGQLTLAWGHFAELADALPTSDARKAIARARAQRIERTMPKLRVRLAAASAPARVLRDGVELGNGLGRALPVDPGVHVVVVSASGVADRTYTVELARGEERDMEVARGAAPVATRPIRPVALVLGGVGIAALSTGATTGVIALGELSGPDASAYVDRARALTLATEVGLGVGLALVTVSLVMLVVSHGHRALDAGAATITF